MPAVEELEIKLGVAPAALRQIEESAPLSRAAHQPCVKHLTSVYYDTDDRKLYKHGVSLRVRFDGTRHVQTIKADAAFPIGLFDRDEWETEVPGPEPDLDSARHTPLGSILSKKLRRSLKPIFETRVERKIFPLRDVDIEVEIAIDRGEITTGVQTTEISEVEIELKEGDHAERLFDLAAAVAEAAPVELEVRSKAERGYALVTGKAPKPERASRVAFPAETTAADAFRVIGRSCLRQIAANAAAVNRDDAKGVHQLRVGLRRLRAAISIFSDMLVGGETSRIKNNLKWLTNELGPARQIHVFDQRVTKKLRRAEFSKSAIAALSADVARRREDAAARAKSAIASDRYRRLLLEVARWIDAGHWLTADDEAIEVWRHRPIGAVAREALQQRSDRLAKRGKKLAEMPNDRRHKLRIAAKKLRYAVEFFASLFPEKSADRHRKRFVKAVRKLQDNLGSLNDIAADEALSSEIASDGSPGSSAKERRRLQYAAGVAAGLEESQRQRLLRASIRAHRRFADAPAFWN